MISTTGAWLPLWFGLLSAHLPLHRQLWEVSPTLLFYLAALTIGWCVARVADRRASLYAISIVLVASPWALVILMAPVAHNSVYPTTALLGAYLLWLTRARPRRSAVSVGVALSVAIALGCALASDALLVATGLVPLLATLAIACMWADRRVRAQAMAGLASVLGAVPVALVVSHVMKAQGYVTVPSEPPLELGTLTSVPRHLRILWEGLRELGNGYLGPSWPGSFHAELGLACDAVLAAGLLALGLLGARAVVRLVGRRVDLDGPDLARSLHVAYWFLSALCVCGAFVFTTAPGVDTQKHEAYYLTLLFSIAAVVPLLARSRSRLGLLIPASIAIFALGSLVGLKRNYLETMKPPIAQYASSIARFAQSSHARYGYSGYWDASSLTWNQHERVLVRPVWQCVIPGYAEACPFLLMRTPSWYMPRPGRSFLLVDPDKPFMTTLPNGLGEPIATRAFGAITMYVYPYDIASKLGPAPN